MLDTLLESKSRSERSAVGAIMSVTAHTVLIAGAIYATANAGLQPARVSQMVHPVYFPPPSKPIQAASPATTTEPRQFDRRGMIFVEPRVEIDAPRIDLDAVGSRQSDFSPAAIAAGPDIVGARSSSGDAPLNATQVEKQVVPLAGNAPPRYPEVLRSSGVEGQVVAVFIVDDEGRVEEGSIRFARSDNTLFADAVRVALRRMRFAPAEVAGTKVRQLVQMPFLFTLAR